MNENKALKSAQFLYEYQESKIYIITSARGLQCIGWQPMAKIPLYTSLSGETVEMRILKKTVKQLDEFFLGKRVFFDLPLDLQGTPFQIQVWKALAQIPYGKTLSYRELAHQLKNEKAVRAVGNANAKNPICIVIPCHRVIASDGTLGGYSGGLTLKKKLLALELNCSVN